MTTARTRNHVTKFHVKSGWYEEQNFLLFHYSGHGSRQRNYTGDEVDRYEESLCLLDVEIQGVIVDDEINAGNVKSLPRGGRLHAIGEAYHAYGIAGMLGIYGLINAGLISIGIILKARNLGLTLSNHSVRGSCSINRYQKNIRCRAVSTREQIFYGVSWRWSLGRIPTNWELNAFPRIRLVQWHTRKLKGNDEDFPILVTVVRGSCLLVTSINWI